MPQILNAAMLKTSHECKLLLHIPLGICRLWNFFYIVTLLDDLVVSHQSPSLLNQKPKKPEDFACLRNTQGRSIDQSFTLNLKNP